MNYLVKKKKKTSAKTDSIGKMFILLYLFNMSLQKYLVT